MKNRASTHLVILLLIIGLEIAGYYALHRSGLIRGYETSFVSAARDLLLYVPIIALVFWLSRFKRYAGSWTLYTTAILLFSVGMLVQYRLYSDPEYGSRNKAQARAEKTKTLQERFMTRFYDVDKKRMMGLPATPPNPDSDISQEQVRPANYTVANALTSGATWIPLFALFSFAVAYTFCVRDDFLQWVQRNSFLIVLITMVPLIAAAATSSAGKSLGNMTPWEPSKIPFLLGFAGILTAHYRTLSQTYWGVPRARDVLPLLAMGVVPFVPFFVLKDFGQMLVFIGAYATLYLVAVRRWTQLVVFVGSLVLVASILIVGALPRDVQEKVPTLATLAAPVKAALPDRIQQRFHLWLDGFDPPSPSVSWWKKDYESALQDDPKKRELAEQSEAMQKSVNVDIWFDKLAFQPAQATFGIAAGGATGRGLGLSFAEVIPIADSDYIYSAIAEELGLIGGAIVIIAILVLVFGGISTSFAARDMFTKLCAAGLAAFIGFQAFVNIGGTVRALPMTGITLPFVSHGGFSLITSFAMLGMLMAFSHRNARDTQLAAQAERDNHARTRLDSQQPVLEAVQ